MTDSDLVIKTDDLGLRFGRNWAVRGLNLEVPRGAIFGFLGPNGAGKSTTIKMLLGLLTPREGEALVLGLDPRRQDTEVKRRVGYVAETPNFYEWMTVEEIMAFVKKYRRNEWDDVYAWHLVEAFKLPTGREIKGFSKGQRAKVSLLLAMAFKPELLLLDEPTGGLDPMARRDFLEKVLGEYMEGGRTVLFSSHLINEIAGIVDHVGILVEGNMVVQQRVDELLDNIFRVRLQFASEQAVPERFDLPGLTRSEVDLREAVLIVRDVERGELEERVRALGAERTAIERLALEEAFIELAGALAPETVGQSAPSTPQNKEDAA